MENFQVVFAATELHLDTLPAFSHFQAILATK